MSGPTREFWQQRFVAGKMPWDRGVVHPQLKQWLEQGEFSSAQSLPIPGCGRGHELLQLAKACVATLGLDYAPAAVALARAQLATQEAGGRGRVEQADVLSW